MQPHKGVYLTVWSTPDIVDVAASPKRGSAVRVSLARVGKVGLSGLPRGDMFFAYSLGTVVECIVVAARIPHDGHVEDMEMWRCGCVKMRTNEVDE